MKTKGMDNMTRHQAFLWIGILAVILTLAGCGGKKDDKAAAGGSAETSTRTYKHAMGETVIPAKPQKVVTLQYVSQMLSVGLKPIAAPDHVLEDMGDAVKGIESLGNAENVNFEKILQLQPDLIIAGDAEQDVYDKLSKIAPTVVVPWMNYDVSGHVKVIGDILNRQKEAEAWQKAFDAKVQEAKKQIEGKIGQGKTFAIYNIRPKEIYVYGVRNLGFTIYKALGLTPPEPVKKEIEKDPNFWAKPVSLEVLPEYSADYLLVATFLDDDSKKNLESIKKSALWANLPAVKNNHVYELDLNRWFGYTPHDIQNQLDDAVKLLSKP
ncbi:ABC transporter substrate-binding protein [Paenibacillus sp. MBLB4367]|uniref:ABC transporter substrate-binding protein n=1 Tax=Paenibacillus sp. MBLB4367 TaxID=3384767 RepID=UPI0039084239